MSLRAIGALVFVAALIGGGLEVGDVALPYMSTSRLILLAAAGVTLLALGVFVERPFRRCPVDHHHGKVYMNVRLSLDPRDRDHPGKSRSDGEDP
ncbi:hypothetical protein IDM40_05015 [Nocardiopsis sp. HNM0947]|uniref:Uncharacterized protein n=1 Tax=Nocardiopsis coralli TaxID=2772213 RepID=A0ABR9P2J7_9ACTN|nr:hypothetical protein [Nocardiopsis coralli]MBE2998068.1 hypothetical protein [Nocardiopsis coralli]